MALQLIGGLIEFPPIPMIFVGGVAIGGGTYALTGASHKAGIVFRAPKTGNLRRIHFATRTVTTGATLDLRLETVSLTDGNPTGTLFGTNTNVSKVLDAADDNAWISSGNLTADAAVTQGDLVAVVIVNPSGSPGNFQIASNSDVVCSLFPYGMLDTTGTWAKRLDMPSVVVEYSDSTYATIPNHYPHSNVNNVSYSNASTPDERGNRFILPFKTRAVGAWFWANGIAGGVGWDVVLYGTDGSTVLASVSLDGDVQQSTGVGGGYRVMFASSVTLDAATAQPYRLIVKPTSASSVTLLDFEYGASAILDATPGGAAMHYTERTDAGSWSDTTTKRAMAGLILDSL